MNAGSPGCGRPWLQMPVAIAILLCGPTPKPAVAQDSAQGEIEHATVMINCPVDQQFGVGILLARQSGRAYVATAGHVVQACAVAGQPVLLEFAGSAGKVPSAVMKLSSRPLDLAVLNADASRVQPPAAVLPATRLGDAESLRRGDALFAVGQAWFSNVTPGLLARTEGPTLQFESHSPRPGSSGGPLVNDRWQLVGLVRSIADQTAEAMAIEAVLATLESWGVPLTIRRLPVVSSGDELSCGLTRRGDVRCWTDRAIGRMPLPADEILSIDGLRLQSVSVGAGHACGLDATGFAYCWGANGLGQLGRGTTFETSDAPARVAGNLRFSSLSAGGWHNCALTTDGLAYCWGAGRAGRLGNDSGDNSAVPVPVAGGLRFRTISAGAGNSCGITTMGEAYCWGGVMGTGISRGGMDPPNAFVPQRAPGGAGLVAISAGGVDSATCALSKDGAVSCWGLADDTGSFVPRSLVPRKVSGSIAFASLHHGIGDHACGTSPDGRAFCWGRNDEGQLGNGTTTGSERPVAVAGELSFAYLVAGHFQTCGVTQAGAVYCWGARLLGSKTGSTTPVKIGPID